MNLRNFLIKWCVNIVTLFVVIHVIAGVSAKSWESVVVAAFILGLFNAFLKPFIIIFTLPFTILTLGLFTLFINAFLFYLASKFVIGFEVINFWSAFWASLLFSIISSILNFMLTPKTTVRLDSFAGRKRYHSNQDDNIIDIEGKTEDQR